MLYAMIRTQIQLPDRDYAHLREAAGRLDRSISDCIREGIALFLRQSPDRGDSFADLEKGFEPLPSERPDSLDSRWADAILASKRTGAAK